MEGISSEAASLAGHLRLSNLCWIYDANRVTIEGHTDITFTEDVAAHFVAYRREVIRVSDPNHLELLERAYRSFLKTGGTRAFRRYLGCPGRPLRAPWERLFARYVAQYPDLAHQLACLRKRELPAGWALA